MIKQMLLKVIAFMGGIEENDVTVTFVRGHVASLQTNGGQNGKQIAIQFNLVKNTPVAGGEPLQTTHRCKLFGAAATEHLQTLKIGAYVAFMATYKQSVLRGENGQPDRWFNEFHANDPEALVILHYSRRQQQEPRQAPQPRQQQPTQAARNTANQQFQAPPQQTQPAGDIPEDDFNSVLPGFSFGDGEAPPF